uniref:Uncharacterized protein n=1 Tax=Leersia perrieri TaxID=77586 RepID=A0A0D9WXR2_9ORYZ
MESIMHRIPRRRRNLDDALGLDLLRVGGEPMDGEASRTDRISRLPEEILGTIVSLLSTKDAACTQAISRHWHPIWGFAPLNLDMNAISIYERKRINIAGHILVAYKGPVQNLVLVSNRLERLPVLNNLSHLNFQFGTSSSTTIDQENSMTYSLVLTALRFSQTLQVLSFCSCCFRDDMMSQQLYFPKLRKLKLYSITASGDVLSAVISACPALEILVFNCTIGLRHLRVSSASLRSIRIGTTHGLKKEVVFQEIVIEDAPLLERLMPTVLNDGPAIIRVISAPRLKEMPSVSMAMSVSTVKILILLSDGPNLAAVVNLLKCFPYLEKIYVRVSLKIAVKNELRNFLPRPVQCLEHHLKSIVLKRYQAKTPVVNFAKFFILNAKVLEVMKFGVQDITHDNEKWMNNQHRRLQLDNKASQDARFEFDSKYWCDYYGPTRIDDFSISDPFDLSLD